MRGYDKMEAIFTRRSIRKYTEAPVTEEDLQYLLSAGMSAPSAGDERPWEFIVITDRNILDEFPSVHPYSGMLREAPAAILVCGDISREKHAGFWVQDCSAATENILIAVAHRGLGSVWLGVYPREDRVKGIRKLLGIPESIIPFALLPVGHPGERKPPKGTIDPDRVHRNRW